MKQLRLQILILSSLFLYTSIACALEYKGKPLTIMQSECAADIDQAVQTGNWNMIDHYLQKNAQTFTDVCFALAKEGKSGKAHRAFQRVAFKENKTWLVSSPDEQNLIARRLILTGNLKLFNLFATHNLISVQALNDELLQLAEYRKNLLPTDEGIKSIYQKIVFLHAGQSKKNELKRKSQESDQQEDNFGYRPWRLCSGYKKLDN